MCDAHLPNARCSIFIPTTNLAPGPVEAARPEGINEKAKSNWRSDFSQQTNFRPTASDSGTLQRSGFVKCFPGANVASAVFRPGDIVPHTGVYRIDHHLHRLMHEATLEEGIRFPLCRQCRAGVTYSLVRAVHGVVPPFRSTAILQEYPDTKGNAKAAGVTED
jgi:hypothetical protein